MISIKAHSLGIES